MPLVAQTSSSKAIPVGHTNYTKKAMVKIPEEEEEEERC